MTDERELLEMALAGYALKRADVERQIERVRVRVMMAMEPAQTHVMGRFGPIPVNPPTQKFLNRKPAKWARKPRKLSPEGRARIIAATKRRWARVRRENPRKGGR